jgi:hypothetical protein
VITTSQATYQPFTDAEEQLIKRGQRDGLQKLFDSPEVRTISMRQPLCYCCCAKGVAAFNAVPAAAAAAAPPVPAP